MTTANASLFTPTTLGALNLPNRIVMAPLTRCRADAAHVPTALMVEYYAQRASAGVIIAEATMVMEGNSSFGGREPGIYSAAQVTAWKKVTDAVHAKAGRIILQLWHGGRACHPYFNQGAQPVAPSALTRATPKAHFKRCASSGRDCSFQRANGPMPMRKIAGAISGMNTASK